MLYFYMGTDREKARGAMNAAVEKAAKKMRAELVRVTDANSLDDLRAALQGPGMFGASRVLILEGIFTNEDMTPLMVEALPHLARAEEPVFLYEEKPLADLRRKLEKYVQKSERFDMPGKQKDNAIFALASALSHGDKKALWVGYQRALGKGERPEAIHGILFWGAKRMLVSARKNSPEYLRGATLIAELAELPHEARRKSIELEYALEHFILGLSR